MGVPVLTKKGNNFASRCGESININLEMNDFIACDDEDYIARAVSLSKNKEKIIQTRKVLRDKASKSPLFDVKSFGQDFSELMVNLSERYSEKLK